MSSKNLKDRIIAKVAAEARPRPLIPATRGQIAASGVGGCV